MATSNQRVSPNHSSSPTITSRSGISITNPTATRGSGGEFVRGRSQCDQQIVEVEVTRLYSQIVLNPEGDKLAILFDSLNRGINAALAAVMDLRAQKLPRRAFTLVELLVVIAVIAILATFFFPALSRAKARAKNVLCENSLRQVGLALKQYTETYDAYPPEAVFNFDARIVTPWNQLLGPDLGRPVIPYAVEVGPSRAQAPFVCPVFSETDLRNMGDIEGYPIQYVYNTWGVVSAIETTISPPLGLAGTGLSVNADGLLGDGEYSIKESDVVAPSEMLALGDPFSRAEAPEHNGYGGMIDFMPIPKGSTPERYLSPPGPQTQQYQYAIRVHGGRYNRFFCDGHVESENFTKPFTITDDYLARWNYDHQPHREDWLRWLKWSF
jgi:prepilin-type N-terminal cleavage/methylation domain-containing protein/prepilin-type processing-associated H-X9-DG protein